MIIEDAQIRRDSNGRPVLLARAWEYFKEQLAEEYLSAEREYEDIFIIGERQKKDIRTIPQLRYLFGHLAPLAKSVLRDQGWETITSKEAAINCLKLELGFCEVHENEHSHGVRLIPKSLSFEARTDRKEVSSFIDRVFMWLIDNGAQPMTPEEYEELKKVERQKQYKKWRRKD